jgi:hypothetical protein
MLDVVNSISTHLDAVYATIRDSIVTEPSRGSPRLSDDLLLKAGHWFSACEWRRSWDHLADACASAFSPCGHGEDRSKWRTALANWFRRRCIYLDCLRGIRLEPVALLQTLKRDLEARTTQLVQLTPLEGVSFQSNRLSFDWFEIVKFETDELESLLEIPTNKAFYPHAVTSAKVLEEYWYLKTSSKAPCDKIGTISFYKGDNSGDKIGVIFSDFETQVQEALKNLLLWHWQGDSERSQPEFGGSAGWSPF